MTNDRDSSSLPLEDLALLRARAAAARLRRLVKATRDLQAQAASLRAENALLRDELCLRQVARGRVDRFP
jgi:hypothetical protein